MCSGSSNGPSRGKEHDCTIPLKTVNLVYMGQPDSTLICVRSRMNRSFDCIVVGGGHAGASAALSAVEAGCNRVLIVEKAPKEWVGGNGYFTAGAFRTVHAGLADLLPLVSNVLADSEHGAQIDVAPYTADDFTRDVMRLGENKPSAALVRAVVDNSREAVRWLAETVRMPFVLAFHRQAYEVNGRHKFWGGLALSVQDGGKGLISADLEALEKRGVRLWFDTPAVELLAESGAVTGVVVRKGGEHVPLKASAVILACGGFEASRELRMKYLGQEWKHARVGRLHVSCQTKAQRSLGSRNAL